jgi:transposase
LYAALDVASGQVITQMTDQHRAVEFRKFLNLINRNVPNGLQVHVICDNASTHKAPEIVRWLARHRRFTVHYTPTYSSWLNQVERWFSELTTKKLRRATHHTVTELRRDINYWVEHWNANPHPFTWRKTADEILDTLATYLQRINDSRH